MESNQMVPVNQTSQVSIYSDVNTFEQAQRICKMLTQSSLVPKEYQNNLANTMIAYEISIRTGMSPFMVMQNLDIIQGRPSWTSKYVIASLNSCGRFSPLQFEYKNEGVKVMEYSMWVGQKPNARKENRTANIEDLTCRAFARDAHGNVIYGPKVSIGMAVKEGWYFKSDSKWPNMPEVMLSYRAAKFFGNLYAPDVLMGMYSSEELADVSLTVDSRNNVTEHFTPIEVINDSVDKRQSDNPPTHPNQAPTEEAPNHGAPQDEELI